MKYAVCPINKRFMSTSSLYVGNFKKIFIISKLHGGFLGIINTLMCKSKALFIIVLKCCKLLLCKREGMHHTIVPLPLLSTKSYSFPSLITPTQAAPIIRNTPANTSIFTSGAMLPSVVNILRIKPPNDAATICGTQMVPLNKPR